MTSAYCQRKRFPDSAIWARYRSGRHLAMFTLELTARCSLDCRHCYVNLPPDKAPRPELSFNEVMSIADQSIELGALWCTLTGGDPLLRDDFFDIYRELRRRGLLITVFTNASLITAEHARLWRDAPPRNLEVTVYGATAETYEQITRRPNSFAAFMRGLDLLHSAGVPVRLKAPAMRSNLHEFPAIVAFCRARSKDVARFTTTLHLRTDGDPARNADILAERLTPREILACQWDDGDSSSHKVAVKTETLPDTDDARHLFRCQAGVSDFTVSWDGQYRLCTSLTAPGTTYDLRAGTVREAWQDFTPTVRAQCATSPAYAAACGTCPLYHLCHCCPAYAYLETGAMDRIPDYFCTLARLRAGSDGP